jgi:medium-chain acyl-[acyl-carrier-protein] hydrolase
LPGVEIVAVEAPGKGARLLEAPCTNLDELCRALLAEIAPLVEQSLPYSFFGHSYGGVLAYELCNRLRESGSTMPRHLLLSACGAPWAREPRGYSMLSDEAFKDLLIDYNATPSEVLANDAMLAMLLPGLRADFAMLDGYESNWPSLEGVSVHVFNGENDDISHEELVAWQQRVGQDVTFESLPGGHFFIHDEKNRLLEAIATQLRVTPAVFTF